MGDGSLICATMAAVAQDAMTKPQLQVGQLWRRRDGGLAKVASKRDYGRFKVNFLPGPGEETKHDPTWFLGWNYLSDGECSGVPKYDLVQLLDGPGANTCASPITAGQIWCASPIAAGQIWRRRDGGEAKILRPYPLLSQNSGWAVELPGLNFPLLSGAGWCYNADGTCGGGFTQYDLISLISEAPTKEPAQQRPPLAVGQRWRRADGQEVVVEGEDLKAPVDSDDRFAVHWDDGSHPIWYGSNGRSNIHHSDPQTELVELIQDVPDSTETASRPTPAPRVVEQIAIADGKIIALAEDGTLWALRSISQIEKWMQLPALPSATDV